MIAENKSSDSYYARNKERLNAASKKNYAENKSHYKDLNKKRWDKNKEKYFPARKLWATKNRESRLSYYKQRGESHRKFLDSLKNKPCQDCLNVYPVYCMEFDHVQGDKNFALGQMANHTREKVLAEIAKCELVCCACHRVRTQSRNTHGQHNGRYKDWSSSRQKKFRDWMDSLKNSPCVDCGKIRPSVAMDFDHIKNDKITGISSMWSWGHERVLAEIAKCELVCCICHRIRTQNRKHQMEIKS